jgi:Cu/Ag efflux protein CusF
LEVAVPGRLAAAFLCAAWLIAGNEVSAGEKEYAVKGMVVSVNAPAKSFVVSHEKIAGLMDAMTMPFEVRLPGDLQNVVPGAVVEFTLVGSSGSRNSLRGDGTFFINLGVGKRFIMPYSERHTLQFRWETFNLLNSVRFDPRSISTSLTSVGSFGKYTQVLNDPRQMQFALRYEF